MKKHIQHVICAFVKSFGVQKDAFTDSDGIREGPIEMAIQDEDMVLAIFQVVCLFGGVPPAEVLTVQLKTSAALYTTVPLCDAN